MSRHPMQAADAAWLHTVGFMVNGRLVEDPDLLVEEFEAAAAQVLSPAVA